MSLSVTPVSCVFHRNISQFRIKHEYFTRWTVFFLKAGEIRYCIEGGNEQTLHPGEMLICPPYYTLDKIATAPLTLAVAFWKGGKDIRNMPLGELVLKMNDRINEDLHTLSNLHGSSPFSLHLQMDIWYQICTLHREPILEVKKARKPNAFLALLDYIDVSLSKKLTLDDLTAYSGYSKSSLIRYFQENTHLTPMQYIIDRRIDRAQRLLSNSKLIVRDIAEQCGFQNEFYFSTAFRKKIGMSPSEFRKQTENAENAENIE